MSTAAERLADSAPPLTERLSEEMLDLIADLYSIAGDAPQDRWTESVRIRTRFLFVVNGRPLD